MRIQHNITAMNSYRNFANNNSALGKNLEKLSSGYKINRAGDDAAGLAISQKMRAQIQGIEGAQKNAKDGISLIQTAEGALQEVHDMLNRMYSLAEQSANGTYDKTLDRAQLQKELDSLRSEINRVADSANFNGMNLLDGSMQDEACSVKFTLSEAKGGISQVEWGDAKGIATGAFKGKTGGVTAEITSIKAAKVSAASGKWVATNAAKANGQGAQIQVKANNVTYTGYVSQDRGAGDQVTLYASDQGLAADGKSSIRITLNQKINVSDTTQAIDQPVAGQITYKVKDSKGANLKLQIGDTDADYNKMTVSVKDMHAHSMGIAGIDISTEKGAGKALDKIKNAVNYVSDTRGNLGALQNRLDHTINNLSVMQENIQNAESTIRDTDMADEMMKYTKNNILNQSAQAMLAQANQLPQGILSLLQ